MTTAVKRAKSSSEEKPLEIVVRPCSGLSEFAACIEIERAVWGSADVDVVPLPLFVVAAETGGQVLGAFAGDRMIGFTLAIAGVHGRKPFLHSHMTAVLRPYRNQGAGRKLKLLQRPAVHPQSLRHHHEPVAWWIAHRPAGRGMALALAARAPRAGG